MLSLWTLTCRNCVRRSWCNKFRYNNNVWIRVSKETRVTNRHRHSDVSAVLRKSQQMSQVRESIFRTCRQTDLLQSAHQLKTKKDGELQTMRKIPVLCCPAPTPPGSYVFCTCMFIRLTLRMYQTKSGIEGCRVQYTYQISFSFSLFRKKTPNPICGIGEGPQHRPFLDLRSVPEAGRLRDNRSKITEGPVTQVLFPELGFFHFFWNSDRLAGTFRWWSEDPSTTWLVSSKVPLAENRFLEARKGAKNTKEKSRQYSLA
jgi:hypothetical protein